jgi:N-acetylglucosaminyl-diphospho-decaprenol L-rhamnosyltransferase
VTRPFNARSPVVSVILVNWNTRDLADAAIASLLGFEKDIPLEIIVVDNASVDGSADFLESRHPGIRVIRNPENAGFARANNRGVAEATGEYVLLLNTDTLFTEEVLSACLETARAQAPAIVSCRLLNADGSLQLSAEAFPRLRTQLVEALSSVGSAQAQKLRRLSAPVSRAATAFIPMDWLCGAFLLVERTVYLSVGGLSEKIFMYGEDIEFCWRARMRGIRSLYLPNVSIVHFGGGGVNHASLRSLTLSDAGRLRSFALMRGRMAAWALRAILVLRSVPRALAWGILGALGQDSTRLKKARNHFSEIFILAGIRDARNII